MNKVRGLLVHIRLMGSVNENVVTHQALICCSSQGPHRGNAALARLGLGSIRAAPSATEAAAIGLRRAFHASLHGSLALDADLRDSLATFVALLRADGL